LSRHDSQVAESTQLLQDFALNAVFKPVLINPMDQQKGQPRMVKKAMAKQPMVPLRASSPEKPRDQTAPYNAAKPIAPRTRCSEIDLLAKRFEMAMGYLLMAKGYIKGVTYLESVFRKIELNFSILPLSRGALLYLIMVAASLQNAIADTPTRHSQQIRANTDGSWTVTVVGSPTDHPGRVQGLAQLYAAQHVVGKKLSYFRVLDTKKAVKCKVSREFGTVEFGFVMVNSRFAGGQSAGNGFIDARSFEATHRAKLLAEPVAEEKREVESRLISECSARQTTTDSLY
jgi:hypothetical protein